jgi:hypothetical protein
MADQDIELPDFHLLGLPLRLFDSLFFAVAQLKSAYRSTVIRFLCEREPSASLACLRSMSDPAPGVCQGIWHCSSLRVYCCAEVQV